MKVQEGAPNVDDQPALYVGGGGYYILGKRVDNAARTALRDLGAVSDRPLAHDEDYIWVPADFIDRPRGPGHE